jgi:alpha-beta hydrolase superfamily lysophospholipase
MYLTLPLFERTSATVQVVAAVTAGTLAAAERRSPTDHGSPPIMRRLLTVLASLLGIFVLAAAAIVVTGRVPGPIGGLRIALPLRNPLLVQPALAHFDWSVTAPDGVTLRGWLFRPLTTPKALIVYLHGKDENRSFGATIAERYVPKGYEVLTFELRGHGRSGGWLTTYGAREVGDLAGALDTIPAEPVILIGKSLGAAIALQAAASDHRVRGVVAAASFADLETRVREAAGRLDVAASLAWLARNADLRVQDISPRKAASQIHVPVLLVHGTNDTVTSFHHSQDIFDALGGERRFFKVDGAGHDDLLHEAVVWQTIDEWLDSVPPPDRPSER